MPSRTILLGNWEKFRLDRYRAVDRCRGVDRNSESKLEPLTAVWPSTIAVHGPLKVFWTAYRAVDRYLLVWQSLYY